MGWARKKKEPKNFLLCDIGIKSSNKRRKMGKECESESYFWTEGQLWSRARNVSCAYSECSLSISVVQCLSSVDDTLKIEDRNKASILSLVSIQYRYQRRYRYYRYLDGSAHLYLFAPSHHSLLVPSWSPLLHIYTQSFPSPPSPSLRFGAAGRPRLCSDSAECRLSVGFWSPVCLPGSQLHH